MVYTGDPPVSSTLANRVSFGGHNPEFEASNRRGRPADDDERPVDDAGASISDADLAARQGCVNFGKQRIPLSVSICTRT